MNADQQIRSILERNRRVEDDKAWETSALRRGCICGFTYVVTSVMLWMMHVSGFWLQALVPAGAYLLSTLSLPWLKRAWLQRYRQLPLGSTTHWQ